MKRGSENIHDVGRVIAFNDKPMLTIYKDEEQCNVINGTDKLFYPPLQRRTDIIWVYGAGACKSFPLRYQYMKTMRGTKTAYKGLSLLDPLVNLN